MGVTVKNLRTAATASVAAVALGLTLAACGGSDDAPANTEAASTSASGEGATVHNDADTEFAQMMIVHHEGAIEMADLAVAQGSSSEVRELGERISGAQDPEIDLMTSWLEAWGEDLPVDAEMGGMDHGAMEMDGMDQEATMDELVGLTGEEFDRRFLELMVEHHAGAVEMAEEHMTAGENAEAVELSDTIIEDQTAEIAEMEDLLAAR
ncbi:DUF305 domain-containing protein [Cellulomonas sp. APG4]|nr:DUF305 domain-containing protein [Cellulomonas sp. APG4]NCT90823.1 DUF305 domain-containing protein [Cellulomonas sp. APG4]